MGAVVSRRSAYKPSEAAVKGGQDVGVSGPLLVVSCHGGRHSEGFLRAVEREVSNPDARGEPHAQVVMRDLSRAKQQDLVVRRCQVLVAVVTPSWLESRVAAEDLQTLLRRQEDASKQLAIVPVICEELLKKPWSWWTYNNAVASLLTTSASSNFKNRAVFLGSWNASAIVNAARVVANRAHEAWQQDGASSEQLVSPAEEVASASSSLLATRGSTGFQATSAHAADRAAGSNPLAPDFDQNDACAVDSGAGIPPAPEKKTARQRPEMLPVGQPRSGAPLARQTTPNATQAVALIYAHGCEMQTQECQARVGEDRHAPATPRTPTQEPGPVLRAPLPVFGVGSQATPRDGSTTPPSGRMSLHNLQRSGQAWSTPVARCAAARARFGAPQRPPHGDASPEGGPTDACSAVGWGSAASRTPRSPVEPVSAGRGQCNGQPSSIPPLSLPQHHRAAVAEGVEGMSPDDDLHRRGPVRRRTLTPPRCSAAMGEDPPPPPPALRAHTEDALATGPMLSADKAPLPKRADPAKKPTVSAAPTGAESNTAAQQRIWRTKAVLGAGSRGHLLAAFDLRTGERYTVRQIPLGGGSGGGDVDLPELVRVLDRIKPLRHGGLVRFFEAEWAAGTVTLFSELCGVSLEVSLREGPQPEHEVLRVARGALCGLVFLHAHGVCHRRLRAANIFPRELRQQVKLSDYGWETGNMPWEPPEMLVGDVEDSPADLWALGIVVVGMSWGEEHHASPGRRRFDRPECRPGTEDSVLGLVSALLTLDPLQRPTAAAALTLDWLR
mmetsp:Transcript_25764/g.62308  ORF Transcript_25764/g.62308 Transcript_25764/m.62308 type:complete len:783 (-) Transcript_25764:22-2370(-)